VPSDEIASAMRTRHVQTPLKRVAAYPDTADAAVMADELAAANFDFAPVTRNGEVSGYVRRTDLAAAHVGTVGEHCQPLTASRLVAGDMSLATLLPALARSPFLFVVDGREIVGILTPAELNKQPGLAYFYLLVAALELKLAERLRAAFPDQATAVGLLPETRQQQVRRRLAEEVRDDVIADAVAAMDLTDLFIVVRKTDTMREAFGDYSRGEWQSKVCKPVTDLRHAVMHAVRTRATDEPAALQRLITLDSRLRALLAT
jgi:hypothetical protein